MYKNREGSEFRKKKTKIIKNLLNESTLRIQYIRKSISFPINSIAHFVKFY